MLEKLNGAYLALSEKFEASKGLYYKSLVKSALEGLVLTTRSKVKESSL